MLPPSAMRTGIQILLSLRKNGQEESRLLSLGRLRSERLLFELKQPDRGLVCFCYGVEPWHDNVGPTIELSKGSEFPDACRSDPMRHLASVLENPDLVIFFSLTEASLPEPIPTPPNTLKRTRNRPETDLKWTETDPNGAETARRALRNSPV